MEWNDDASEYVAKTFKNLQAESTSMRDKLFEDCQFHGCHFSESTFEKCRFNGCQFNQCNLSLVKIPQSKFFEVTFDQCKLVGVDWTRAAWPKWATPGVLKFYNCILNDSSFYGLQLEELVMESCKVHEADFSEGNFSSADFKFCDFAGSIFRRSRLTGADFTEAVNYSIDVLNNEIKGAKFSRFEAVRLLEGLGIELVD